MTFDVQGFLDYSQPVEGFGGHCDRLETGRKSGGKGNRNSFGTAVVGMRSQMIAAVRACQEVIV